MSMHFFDASLQVPCDWTPEEALILYEYLTEMTAAVWQRYEAVLLPLLRADPVARPPTQLDLLDPDDELPF
jgi:hypothetical protein